MKPIVRMTKQRKIILGEIQKLRTHPTADELYEIVRNLLPKISLGTVYRNIETLCRAGLINKLDTSGSQLRVDGNIMPHWHVMCKDCGKIEDIISLNKDIIDKHVEKNSLFKYIDNYMEIRGICPKCQNKS